MSYSLLSVPDGYRTSLALVIAPYVDLAFLTELAKELKPARLCLLVDDAIQPDALEKILRSRPSGMKIEVRVARATGLMHMKAFFFEFARGDGQRSRRKRQLLFGSANATNAAFDGRINGELVADSELMIRDDSEIGDYFSKILETFDSSTETKIEGFSGWLSQAPAIHLPSVKIAAPDNLSSGFDAWLQRGLLAAQYRNAPQFGILNIKLKRALPRGEIAEIFSRSSFTEKGERDVVRYGYLNGADAVQTEDSEVERAQWKARFTVWTHFGEWLSYECHRAHSRIMKSKASTTRSRNISVVLECGRNKAWIESRVEQLVTQLDRVWTDLQAAGFEPGEYLESSRRTLDPAPYRKRFVQKLEQDLQLAMDKDFKKRYVNGYEFPSMPRFRQDTTAWEAFVRSWCESIAVEAVKNRPLSLVAKRTKDVMDELKRKDLQDLSPGQIEKLLRTHWEKQWKGKGMSLGEWVMAYPEG